MQPGGVAFLATGGDHMGSAVELQKDFFGMGLFFGAAGAGGIWLWDLAVGIWLASAGASWHIPVSFRKRSMCVAWGAACYDCVENGSFRHYAVHAVAAFVHDTGSMTGGKEVWHVAVAARQKVRLCAVWV